MKKKERGIFKRKKYPDPNETTQMTENFFKKWTVLIPASYRHDSKINFHAGNSLFVATLKRSGIHVGLQGAL